MPRQQVGSYRDPVLLMIVLLILLLIWLLILAPRKTTLAGIRY
jgi:hypothetical protein